MSRRNALFSYSFSLVMALSFFSAEAISEGGSLVPSGEYAEVSETIQRAPAAAGEDGAESFIENSSAQEAIAATLSDLECEREWLVFRRELYSNVSLSDTESVWLNEIEDTVRETELKLEMSVVQAMINDPYAEENYMKAMIAVFDQANAQKEEYIGQERFQYLLRSRNQFIESYQIRTGRVLNLRW